MIQLIGLMIAAYIFTRMFTAAVSTYPSEDKTTALVIKVLSLFTALFAFGCGAWLVLGPSLNDSLRGLVK